MLIIKRIKCKRSSPNVFVWCLFWLLFSVPNDHRLGQWTLLIADRYESLFGLLIQFNAFLVCSLFIPSQCHLSAFCSTLLVCLTVFECHGRWWIRINVELSPSGAHTFHMVHLAHVNELIMIWLLVELEFQSQFKSELNYESFEAASSGDWV